MGRGFFYIAPARILWYDRENRGAGVMMNDGKTQADCGRAGSTSKKQRRAVYDHGRSGGDDISAEEQQLL